VSFYIQNNNKLISFAELCLASVKHMFSNRQHKFPPLGIQEHRIKGMFGMEYLLTKTLFVI